MVYSFLAMIYPFLAMVYPFLAMVYPFLVMVYPFLASFTLPSKGVQRVAKKSATAKGWRWMLPSMNYCSVVLSFFDFECLRIYLLV